MFNRSAFLSAVALTALLAATAAEAFLPGDGCKSTCVKVGNVCWCWW